MVIDRYLTFGPHLKKVIGTARSKYPQMWNTRKTTDKATTMLLYKQMVLPCLEYCPLILDSGPAWAVTKLQTIQNDCLRICNNIQDACLADVDDLHVDADLEKLHVRRNRHLLTMMYKRSTDPDNLVQPRRNLRGNIQLKFKLKRHSKNCYLNSPEYRGSRLWDRLTPEQQKSDTKDSFKMTLTPENLRPLEPLVV